MSSFGVSATLPAPVPSPLGSGTASRFLRGLTLTVGSGLGLRAAAGSPPTDRRFDFLSSGFEAGGAEAAAAAGAASGSASPFQSRGR